MVRSMGMVCTGTLLVLLAGCSLDEFTLSLSGAPKGREQVYDGPPDVVQVTAMAAMEKLNMMVEMTPTGDKDTVRLKAKAPYGQTFVMVLKRQKSAQGDKTAVHLEWEKAPDEKTEGILLSFMTNPQGQQGGQGFQQPMGQPIQQMQGLQPGDPIPGYQQQQYMQPGSNLMMGRQ
jgi:hypothetical protein